MLQTFTINTLYVSYCAYCMIFFFKQKTAYEMRISDWSSDVCSSDLRGLPLLEQAVKLAPEAPAIRINYAKALIKAGKGQAARTELQSLEIGRASCRERVCQYV